MSWSTALILIAASLILFGVLAVLLDKIATWLYKMALVRQMLNNRRALWGVNLTVVFVLPWTFCGGLTLLAVWLENRVLAIAALVVGFPSLILIPFFYSALLTRLRRLQTLAQ